MLLEIICLKNIDYFGVINHIILLRYYQVYTHLRNKNSHLWTSERSLKDFSGASYQEFELKI